MRVVVAPDKFKGSLSASEVANCIEKGIQRVDASIEVVKIPMADGGEGTVQAIVDSCSGRIVKVKVKDPLMREIDSFYGLLEEANTAVIEMAAASGLMLLSHDERNPLKTTTYGLGELIKHALEAGCKNIFLGIGGSATNDGGAGMLQALGARLLDADGKEIGYGAEGLIRVKDIDISGLDQKISECRILVACDVDNPLCGPNGASFVYGIQKGADLETAGKLDACLLNFGNVIERKTGIQVIRMSGAGAAGGVGISLKAFMGAELNKGIELIAEITKLYEQLKEADLVFTGEGKIDSQTAFGKTPLGVAQAAKKFNLPVIALTGALGEGSESLGDKGFDAIFSIMNKPMALEQAMRDTKELLVDTTEQVMRAIKIGLGMKKV
ncbi:MAG: glycerate kinase [Clostridia bacterium]|nr:glycerate kinase [Clostridia bacterium]